MNIDRHPNEMIVNCFLPSLFSETEKNAQTRSKTAYHVSNAMVICFSKNAISGIMLWKSTVTFHGARLVVEGNTIPEVLEGDKFFSGI